MAPIIILSSTLSAADIWNESDTISTGLSIEVVGSLEMLQERTSSGPLLTMAGEDAAQLRRLLGEHLSRSSAVVIAADVHTRDLKLPVEVDEMHAIIFDSSHEVLVLLDMEGNIVLCNRAFRDIVGQDTKEMVGRPLLSFLEEDSDEVMARLIYAASAKERSEEEMVLEVQRKDGSVAVLEVKSHALNRNGHRYWIQLIGRDISEKRKRDSELELANKKLVLLGSMTRHDILNKAMILSGYIEMAMFDPSGPEGKASLDSAQRVLESVVRIMESTRNYQKLGASDPIWINIAKEVAAYTRGSDFHGVELICATGGMEVLADPMFVNGLRNLIENSVLHGKRTTRITISAARKDRTMVLRISDDGVGIPAEDKERIFNWSHKNRSGHGLHLIREALAITDIEIHEVGVAGQGAVFELIMPKGRYRMHSRETAKTTAKE